MNPASRQALAAWAQRWSIDAQVEAEIAERAEHHPSVPPFTDVSPHTRAVVTTLATAAVIQLRDLTFPLEERLS